MKISSVSQSNVFVFPLDRATRGKNGILRDRLEECWANTCSGTEPSRSRRAKKHIGDLYEQFQYLAIADLKNIIRKHLDALIDEQVLPNVDYIITSHDGKYSKAITVSITDAAIDRLYDAKNLLDIGPDGESSAKYVFSQKAINLAAEVESVLDLYNKRIYGPNGKILCSHFARKVHFSDHFKLKRLCQEIWPQ